MPMSTTAPSSAVLPNPEALHKVFDAEFQTVLAQARKELGEAVSLAPRVAEGAFVRAWDARGRLQSMDELKEFLRTDVKHAAGRALSRRKAIQDSGESGQITLGDGTEVRLAPDSKLFVPADFGNNIRPVKLDGAASFSVASGSGEFRVYMRNAVISAHGTKFVVSARWGDTAVAVKVTEG